MRLFFSLLIPALVIIIFFIPPVFADDAATAAPEAIPDGQITGIDETQIDAFRISLKGSDGIKFGDTLQIIRGGEVIGEAYVVSTDENNVVISVKGEAKATVRKGDIVHFLRHKKELPKSASYKRTWLGLFNDVESRSDLLECSKCGLKMEKSFITRFNDTDHYAVCLGKTHEFYARNSSTGSTRGTSSGQQGGSGGESRDGTNNVNTSRDAQEIFKAPENWTENVSTVKYEDWGKQVRSSTLPSVSNMTTISGYGKTDDGKEIKMQIIEGGTCIKVISP